MITLLDLCVSSPHCLPINRHITQQVTVVGIIWLSQHRHLNTPPQSGRREISRFVHKTANIMLQFVVVSIIEDRQFFSCCELLIPVTLINARVRLKLLQFLHQGMSNPSFLPTCPELLVAHVLSAILPRSPAYPARSSR